MDVFLQAVVVIGAVVIGVRFGSIGFGIYDAGRRRHRLHCQNRRTNHARESQTHCFHCTARHMVFLFLSRYG